MLELSSAFTSVITNIDISRSIANTIFNFILFIRIVIIKIKWLFNKNNDSFLASIQALTTVKGLKHGMNLGLFLVIFFIKY
ncbi:Hypothetical protein Nlim_0280 [Candidatus Nitrosarchaeum limnium SFB1]|uniref:Uncharacterized protein n=1 Tax=Candidatus Nitrosarchaeum limnium SFB1 TaxID=886738 RepID=F3KII2_9ARCH|nr:Hypothetical protein Nlim_0280 [Candidatus Nitrosarchaeum limnium SFB1]